MNTPLLPGATPTDPEPARPHRLWGMLRRNLGIIAVFAVLGAVLGAAAASRIRPQYASTVRLELAERSAPALAAVQASDPVADAARIGTEMEVLRSRTLAEAVVDSLGLRVRVSEPEAPRAPLFADLRLAEDEAARLRLERGGDGAFRVLAEGDDPRELGRVAPGGTLRLPSGGTMRLADGAAAHREIVVEVVPRDDAADAVAAATEVSQPSPGVSIIHVSYRGVDRTLARDVPNALTAHYMRLRSQSRGSEARSSVRFLRGQLDTIRAQLAGAEGRLQRFRETEQVVDLPVEASTQVTRMAQLEAERGALAAEQQALARMLAEARNEQASMGQSPYRRLVAFPALMRNNVAGELISSLAQVENQRAEMLQRRRPDDPEVLVLTRRVDEIEAQIRGMVTTYQQGISSQVSSLDATIGTFGRRMDRVPAREVEFARLARQTRGLEEMHGLLATRLKEAEIAEAREDTGVRVLDAARLPRAPEGGRRPLVLVALTLLGAGLGTVLAFAREYRDVSVRSREDVEAATALPVLGWLPRLDAGAAAPRRLALRSFLRLAPPRRDPEAAPTPAQLARWTPALPTAWDLPRTSTDAFEWLHRNVLFAAPGGRVRTLVFTSPLPGDGKTTSAAGMAVTLARRGLRILLVDADLRRGTASSLFDGTGPGLSELLAGRAPIQSVLRTVEVGEGEALHYLPCGSLPADPIRLVDSPRMAALLEWLGPRYDMVLVDTPPLNLFADAAVLGGLADAVLLVARAGVTPFDALVHAAEQCRRAQVPCAGAVLNGIGREADADPVGRWQEYGRAYYASAGS